MDLLIEKGNIIYCDTDAIVLPANPSLKEGSGASRAIYKAAGEHELKKACEKIKKPVELGMAVPTSGYALKADYVIHAVVPKWKDGISNEYELLSSAYRSSLEVADRMKCKSIAFPLLSAGNNGFDRELAFRIAVESINSYRAECLDIVKLLIYDEEIAVYIQSQGYDVTNRFVSDHRIPAGKKIIKVAKDYIDDMIQIGLDYLDDPKIRKRIIESGVKIVAAVLRLPKPPKR